MSLKHYFDVNNPPFGVELQQRHAKIKKGNRVSCAIDAMCGAAGALILFSVFILPLTPVPRLLFVGCFSVLVGLVVGWAITSKSIAKFLLGIQKEDCIAVVDLRDNSKSAKISGYINQVIAQRELQNWELSGLVELDYAAYIATQTAKQSAAEQQACKDLYVSQA